MTWKDLEQSDQALEGIKETKHCACAKCGKEWHLEHANYCGICGDKLKEASAKDSL